MTSHITIAPIARPVTISAGTVILGQSAEALELKEGRHAPVVYIPRADVDMTQLARTDRVSSCPWKGRASYYSIKTAEGTLDNAVWSYEEPLPEMSAIAGHLAFYTDRVTVTRG